MKNEITVRKAGKLYFDYTEIKGEGSRTVKTFLSDMTELMVKNSVKHIENVGFPPFVYREKQLNTIMAPSISAITEAFIMESSVERKWSALSSENLDDSHGWVDYWCLYNEYNYYIELKHGFISYRNNELRKNVKAEWEKACDQLDVIQDEINQQKAYAKGVFTIVFQVLPIYIGAKDENKLSCDQDKLMRIQSSTMKNISNKRSANWSCLWVLNDNIQDFYEYENVKEKYPAVLFLANVSEIVKKESVRNGSIDHDFVK